MAGESPELLTTILRDVSRSFYKTLRVLPARIRPQISLAYLLARTTDTIADTELVPLERRLEALAGLRERINGSRREPVDFVELARCQGSTGERILLARCEEAIRALGALGTEDLQSIRQVLGIITSGQELDLRRFGGGSSERILALQDEQELDDYTYRVAGCVGEFWTRICRRHLFPGARLDEAGLLEKAVRFGKGLQLVNILRDLPGDLRHGRCYLPAHKLAVLGLQPTDLLNAGNESRLRPLYDHYLDQAEAHLHSGWTYTNLLPRTCVRVRLACAWPILIGLDTLKLLRQKNVLGSDPIIKVSRAHVKRLILRSVLYYPWPKAWQGLVRGSEP